MSGMYACISPDGMQPFIWFLIIKRRVAVCKDNDTSGPSELPDKVHLIFVREQPEAGGFNNKMSTICET